MRIIVIGGTRFIGPYVVTSLARADHEVVVFAALRVGMTNNQCVTSTAIVRTDNPPGTLALQWDHHLVTDTRAIRSDLGYNERISREEALARTLVWERHARRRCF